MVYHKEHGILKLGQDVRNPGIQEYAKTFRLKIEGELYLVWASSSSSPSPFW
ncbi:hypothetical protein BOH78_3823 [Pichia kudriavzevii]|uniref:Uncharacterized protein n=1 Tax=Pichia kudriavzevii TaxID=4909 RepID=A0A099NU21_PICKU|nr:hypothetical protein JL09_g5479 [Pichia kudriavzevii]ONH72458.1 hypothetical protein BOH78_3823 [Pichia kudriavzevii]